MLHVRGTPFALGIHVFQVGLTWMTDLDGHLVRYHAFLGARYPVGQGSAYFIGAPVRLETAVSKKLSTISGPCSRA